MRKTYYILFIFLLSFVVVNAQQKKLALVIGNAAYTHGGSLKNPVNDARLMSSTLRELGFRVITKTNASLSEMQDGFKDFAKQIPEHDVALFYYAGHGMQINGENYLIPVDAKLEDKIDIDFQAFKVSNVNRYFAYNDDKLNIMILDACRNNPYRSWMRSGARGFKAVQNQAAGTIIAFATREGETASDGSGNNGLFTKHLVEQMKIPQNITDVFQNTRIKVLAESNKQQVPQEWNMLTGNFYFTGSSNSSNSIQSNNKPMAKVKEATFFTRSAGTVKYKLTPEELIVTINTPYSPSFDVDVNNNKIIDKNIDRAYGIVGGNRICAQFLIDNRASTTCGQESNAYLDKQGNNYTFAIPVSEVFKENTINLTFSFWTGSQHISYPSKSYLFSEGYSLSLW